MLIEEKIQTAIQFKDMHNPEFFKSESLLTIYENLMSGKYGRVEPVGVMGNSFRMLIPASISITGARTLFLLGRMERRGQMERMKRIERNIKAPSGAFIFIVICKQLENANSRNANS